MTLPSRGDTVEVYKAKDGWRWRRVAGNGAIVADSGESYRMQSSAENAAERQELPIAEVVVRDEDED